MSWVSREWINNLWYNHKIESMIPVQPLKRRGQVSLTSKMQNSAQSALVYWFCKKKKKGQNIHEYTCIFINTNTHINMNTHNSKYFWKNLEEITTALPPSREHIRLWYEVWGRCTIYSVFLYFQRKFFFYPVHIILLHKFF